MRDNRQAYQRLRLVPRVMVNVSHIDLSYELLGAHSTNCCTRLSSTCVHAFASLNIHLLKVAAGAQCFTSKSESCFLEISWFVSMSVCIVTGRKLSMPVLIAPMSAMLMAHKEGEPATARAAVKANTSMVICFSQSCLLALLHGRRLVCHGLACRYQKLTS